MTTTYAGWWQVPDHLMPATALGELEYPRTADGQPPVAWVDTRDWRDRKTSIPLYDARACPPTRASAAQLDAAARDSKRHQRRTCTDCGAHCQRPLPPGVDVDRTGFLCPACRHIALLRREQAELAEQRRAIIDRAVEVLGWEDAAVVQADLVVPPPTPAGSKRKPTAVRVWAVDLTGARLVDVTVRLVSTRAKFVPGEAVDPEQAGDAIRQALLGRRLIAWHNEDFAGLRAAAPHPTWPGGGYYGRIVQFPEYGQRGERLPEQAEAVALWHSAAVWRGQLDAHTRQLVQCLPPGTPDRLLLMLRRIAHTPPAPQQHADVQLGGAAVHTPTARELGERCQPLVRLAGVAGDFWNHAHNLLGTLEHLAATDPEVAALHAQTELLIDDYNQATAAYDQAAANSHQAGGAQPAGRR